jgi:hypothetical protein
MVLVTGLVLGLGVFLVTRNETAASPGDGTPPEAGATTTSAPGETGTTLPGATTTSTPTPFPASPWANPGGPPSA